MKDLSLEKMENVNGEGFWCDLGCGVAVGIATAVASPTVAGAIVVGAMGSYVCSQAICGMEM